MAALINVTNDPTDFVNDAQQLSQDLQTLAIQAASAQSPDSAAFVNAVELFASDAELASVNGQIAQHSAPIISAARNALINDCGLPGIAAPSAGHTGSGNSGTGNTGSSASTGGSSGTTTSTGSPTTASVLSTSTGSTQACPDGVNNNGAYISASGAWFTRITPTGMTCSAAMKLVRMYGVVTNWELGLASAQVDGFTCVMKVIHLPGDQVFEGKAVCTDARQVVRFVAPPGD